MAWLESLKSFNPGRIKKIREIYESVEIAHQKDISFGFPGGRGWRKIYAVDLIIPEDRSYRGNRLQFQL